MKVIRLLLFWWNGDLLVYDTFAFKDLISDQIIKIFLEVSLGWVTFVDDFSLLVDEHDTWDAFHTVGITAIGFVSPVVFDGAPFLGVDMFLEGVHV